MIDEERHPGVDAWGVDQVVVIEHHHDIFLDGVRLVEQRREHRLDRGWLG